MPYCPCCKFEYRPGVTTCPDCGEALLEGTPPRPQPELLPRAETKLVALCRVADPTEADIIKAALLQAGITALVRRHGPLTGELAAVADGVTHDFATVFVTRNRLVEAERVLAEIQSGPVQWPEGMEPDEEGEAT